MSGIELQAILFEVESKKNGKKPTKLLCLKLKQISITIV